MITTGSKFLFGVGAFGLVAAIVYALASNNELTGVITLGSLGVVALVLGGIVIAFRDGEVATVAYPDGAAENAATTGPGPLVSPAAWPALGALGAALLLLGLVFEWWMAVAGIVLLLGVILEWMVQAWADRASDDAEYNVGLRRRMMHPIEFPILGALGAGLVVFAFSQVMLTLDKNAAVVVFIVVAALILVVAGILAGARTIGSSVIVATLMVGGIIALTAGTIGAIRGSRDFHAHEGEGANTESVADVANMAARVTLSNGTLSPDTINLARAQPANLTFTNSGGPPRRLVVEAEDLLDSNGEPNGSKVTYATALSEDGQTVFLTFQINLPGSYSFFTEAEDGTDRIEGTIVVA